MKLRAFLLGACAFLGACASAPSAQSQTAGSPATPLQWLVGCFSATGEVQGKPVTALARGSWHLGGRYLLWEVHGLDPADPYDAAIVMADAGEGAVNAYWMDSFGGAYSVSGAGHARDPEIVVTYAYPDATYVNHYTRNGLNWDWRVEEQRPDQPPTLFGRYSLTSTACDAMPNVF